MAEVSRIILGTGSLVEAPAPRELLDQFCAAGGTRLDLANVYANGESTRLVGDWLDRRRLAMPPIFYVKGCHPPLCSPDLVSREVDRARSLLRIDVLDHFILHRDDSEVDVGTWAESLRAELRRGSVRLVGVSNWTLRRFCALRTALGEDAGALRVFNNHLSLARMTQPIAPGCVAMSGCEARSLVDAGIEVVAWAALAGGFFSGRTHPSWRGKTNIERRDRVGRLARRMDVPDGTLALAWLLQSQPCLLPVVGTRYETHLRELLLAAAIELTPEEIDWLEIGGVEP